MTAPIDPNGEILAAKYPVLYEYHLGVAGRGKHAFNWDDKPHRLVYDLTRNNAIAADALKALYIRLLTINDRSRSTMEFQAELIAARDVLAALLEKPAQQVQEECEEAALKLRLSLQKPRVAKNPTKDKLEEARIKNSRAIRGSATVCAHCQTIFEQSEYAQLCDAIGRRLPACSYECNKALGQVTIEGVKPKSS